MASAGGTQKANDAVGGVLSRCTRGSRVLPTCCWGLLGIVMLSDAPGGFMRNQAPCRITAGSALGKADLELLFAGYL